MSSPSSTTSAQLRSRVLAAVQASPAPTRQQGTWAVLGVLLAAIAVAAALFFASGGLPHGVGRAPTAFASSMSVWVLAALVSLSLILSPARTPLGRKRPWLLGIALGTPTLVYLFMLGLSNVLRSEPALLLKRPDLACFGLTLAAASLPMLLLMRVRRGTDPVHPAAQGAAVGAAFGALAGVMVCLWCPDVSPLHIALGHVAPLLVLAGFGGWLGQRMLSLRASR